METPFSKYLSDLRSRVRVPLREVCVRGKLDPSNYSKYERAVLPAPGPDVLKKIAKGLKLDVRSPEYHQLRDLAHAERGVFPADVLNIDDRIVSALPAFFQHLRDHGLSDDEDPVETMVHVLRKAV